MLFERTRRSICYSATYHLEAPRKDLCTEPLVLAAPERIHSKIERLSAQIFTRRYKMMRDTVTDRAPRAFTEQAPGSRRTERANPEKADLCEQANQTPSQGACAWCARCVFFLRTKRIFKEILWGHPSSLVVLHKEPWDYFSQTKAASGLKRSLGCVEILYGL